MNLSIRYLSGSTGLLGGLTQYTYLFILSINPAIFKLFRPRHYAMLGVGILVSLFNHRAILPFMLLICLDLDYANLNPKLVRWLLFFFTIGCAIISMFGGSAP